MTRLRRSLESLDWWLLRHQPHIWAMSPESHLRSLIIVSVVWSAIAIAGARLISTTSVIAFPFFVGGVAMAALIAISVVMPVWEALSPEVTRSNYSVPGWEIDADLRTRLVRLSLYAVWAGATVVAFRGVEWIYDARLAGLRPSAEVVRDLQAINDGAAACCAIAPASQACLDRQRLPRSPEEERILIKDYGVPEAAVIPRGAEAQTVRAADVAITRYAPSKKISRTAEYRDYERAAHGYRAREDAFADPRPHEQRVCAELNFTTYRTVDVYTSRILSAQRVFPEASAPRWRTVLDIVVLAALAAACLEFELAVPFFLWILISAGTATVRFAAGMSWWAIWIPPAALAIAAVLAIDGHRRLRHRPRDSQDLGRACWRLFAFPGVFISVMVFDAQPLVTASVDRLLVLGGSALVFARSGLVVRWNRYVSALPRKDTDLALASEQEISQSEEVLAP